MIYDDKNTSELVCSITTHNAELFFLLRTMRNIFGVPLVEVWLNENKKYSVYAPDFCLSHTMCTQKIRQFDSPYRTGCCVSVACAQDVSPIH